MLHTREWKRVRLGHLVYFSWISTRSKRTIWLLYKQAWGRKDTHNWFVFFFVFFKTAFTKWSLLDWQTPVQMCSYITAVTHWFNDTETDCFTCVDVSNQVVYQRSAHGGYRTYAHSCCVHCSWLTWTPTWRRRCSRSTLMWVRIWSFRSAFGGIWWCVDYVPGTIIILANSTWYLCGRRSFDVG